MGMMVIAVGLSSYNVALFHLVNHAFYKGLLFLGAGSVIHAWADNQDFRKYGGLRAFLPLTYSVMLIASLSLVAFPFMTGFYSKDFILESAYGQFYFSSTVVYFIATIGAMFTTLYSVKVLYLTFLTNPNGPLVNYRQTHESDIFMSLPLIILAFFSIFFGYITKDIFIGLGSGFFADNGLFIHPRHEIMLDTEFAVPPVFKLLPLIFTILLSVISIVLSEFLPKLLIRFKFSRFGYNIFSFFNQRFLIELFYNLYITDLILKLGGQTTKVIDKGSVELLGPYGLEKGLLNLSKNIASLDTGVITSYALYILVGLIFYILIPYLSLTDNSLIIIMLFGLISLTESKKFSIPEPHAFVSLPLQSLSFNFDRFKCNLKARFSYEKIFLFFITLSILFYGKHLVITYFDLKMANYLHYMIVAWFGGLVGWFLSCYFESFSMTSHCGSPYYFISKSSASSNSGLASSSGFGSGSRKTGYSIGEVTNSNLSDEKDEFANLETDKYPPIVASNSRSAKDNVKISKLRLELLKKECKNLASENFNLMTKRENEVELSENINLSTEDRAKHREKSQILWDKGQTIKENYKTKLKLAESLENQLCKNPNYNKLSESDINSSSDSSMDDVDI